MKKGIPMSNKNILKNITELKTISGIDTLYYFCETNKAYERLYAQINESLEEQMELMEIRGIDQYTSELTILIKKEPFTYLGKSEGYLWFVDMNSIFKIGFKDFNSNTGLHNIRVQLLSNGIYAIGIKELVPHIDELFKKYLTGYKPITRADLNTFVQLDLSFIDEGMFATRKRDMDIRKKMHSNIMQTIYVGKKPFLLRIYNKKDELANTHKEKLMRLYFEENGFRYDQPIFNVEFELHRQFMRTYNIDTVDDLLQNAQQLFSECIDAIRLIDESTLRQTTTNRYRAQTHPIWVKLKENYSLMHFNQSETLLEKLKRKHYNYELETFEKDFKAIIKRAIMYSLPVTIKLLEKYYKEMKDEMRMHHDRDGKHKPH